MALKVPSPKNILRIAVTACFVGAMIAAIAGMPRVLLPGDVWHPASAAPGRVHELSGFLLFSAIAFLLLYIEHAATERTLKRQLNPRLGYLQSLGCVAVVLAGTLSFLAAAAGSRPLLPEAVHSNLLLVLCIYGEAAFVMNVAWTVVQKQRKLEQAIPADEQLVRAARGPVRRAGNIGYLRTKISMVRWPRSAARAFVITATLLAAIGLTLNLWHPLAHLPMQIRDQIILLPVGAPYVAAAMPFVIFAALYRIAETHHHATFRSAPTRMHLICTLLLLLEVLRLYFAWAISTSLTNPVPLNGNDMNGVFGFGFLSAVTFVWNLSQSRVHAEVE